MMHFLFAREWIRSDLICVRFHKNGWIHLMCHSVYVNTQISLGKAHGKHISDPQWIERSSFTFYFRNCAQSLTIDYKYL